MHTYLHGQTYFKNLSKSRFLKYVWPFFNINHENVKVIHLIAKVKIYHTHIRVRPIHCPTFPPVILAG